MTLEYINEWMAVHPFLIEFVVLPIVSKLYSEVWDHAKKWYSNYKTHRYQNVLVKRQCDILP